MSETLASEPPAHAICVLSAWQAPFDRFRGFRLEVPLAAAAERGLLPGLMAEGTDSGSAWEVAGAGPGRQLRWCRGEPS